jgi:hypothetical protein
MKNGAVVHGARDEVELQRLVDRLGVEVAVVDRMAIEIVLAAVSPSGSASIRAYLSHPFGRGRGRAVSVRSRPAR